MVLKLRKAVRNTWKNLKYGARVGSRRLVGSIAGKMKKNYIGKKRNNLRPIKEGKLMDFLHLA
jgi:hypothetical protein